MFLSDLCGFGNSSSDVGAFGDTDADFVLAVADNDKSTEAEAAAKSSSRGGLLITGKPKA